MTRKQKIEAAANAVAIYRNHGEERDSDGRYGLEIWVPEVQRQIREEVTLALQAAGAIRKLLR